MLKSGALFRWLMQIRQTATTYCLFTVGKTVPTQTSQTIVHATNSTMAATTASGTASIHSLKAWEIPVLDKRVRVLMLTICARLMSSATMTVEACDLMQGAE